MAAVSGATLAKVAAAVLSNDKLRKGVGWIVVAILSPIIVTIALILAILSGTASHNSTALELSFNGGAISEKVPVEFRTHIEDMRYSFGLLDYDIKSINSKTEDDESLDSVRVKAIFYALYFGDERPSLINTLQFADCFVVYEKRTRTVTNEDGSTSKETYTVAVPIQELSIIYENIAKVMGVTATADDRANATEIYYRIKYGRPAPTYGKEFDDFTNGLPVSDVPFVGVNGFTEPVANWRSSVTSEFGYRKDPFTGQKKGHGGIDIGKPKGTPIYSALDGTVMLVRYSNTGYGYHVMVDHGGGFITLYGHCSKLLVSEGQTVSAGTKIAEVGTTGRSTGNHLHFEIRINGEKQNPRSYLP